MVDTQQLQDMGEQQLRALASTLIAQIAQRDQLIARKDQDIARKDQLIASKDQDILYRQAKIDQLSHEMAVLKRWKFGKSREHIGHADSAQASLLDESIDADIAAIEVELERLAPTPKTSTTPRATPKRSALAAHLARREVRHEPDSTTCTTPGCGGEMKRIGEDVAERLDYVPGVFTVERHVRGKWTCACCQTLIQAPVPAQVIDKGVPTAGLLAQVLVAKYADHLPLYRQEAIFARAGVTIPRSTLGQWVGMCGVQLQPLVDALKAHVLQHCVLHGDETPVQMLKPGGKGSGADQGGSAHGSHGSHGSHRAYIWAYSPGVFEKTKAVIYDFCESRAGSHARSFLGPWLGTLVTDAYAGYKQSYTQGITEAGCWAHARRKFFDLHVSSQSAVAAQALAYIGQLYEVEREARDVGPDERLGLRQTKSRPLVEAMYAWMVLMRQKVTDGAATAKALDYSLKRWVALTRFVDDPQLPIDNNHIENLIRPIALGKKNWLFAGSLRAGQRAAAVMSLIQSARMNGHDPHEYLRDVLTRLPTQKNSQIDELLPHLWQPRPAAATTPPNTAQPTSASPAN
jgi:transposase